MIRSGLIRGRGLGSCGNSTEGRRVERGRCETWFWLRAGGRTCRSSLPLLPPLPLSSPLLPPSLHPPLPSSSFLSHVESDEVRPDPFLTLACRVAPSRLVARTDTTPQEPPAGRGGATDTQRERDGCCCWGGRDDARLGHATPSARAPRPRIDRAASAPSGRAARVVRDSERAPGLGVLAALALSLLSPLSRPPPTWLLAPPPRPLCAVASAASRPSPAVCPAGRAVRPAQSAIGGARAGDEAALLLLSLPFSSPSGGADRSLTRLSSPSKPTHHHHTTTVLLSCY
jgi:hypothetical protein